MPPEGRGTRVTVAHFRKGGPAYDDPLSRLGDLQAPLLLVLPMDLAVALRRELNDRERLRVGWEAAANCALLALLGQDDANGCRWDTLVPRLDRHHTYMSTALRPPCLEWDDHIAAFQDHGVV